MSWAPSWVRSWDGQPRSGPGHYTSESIRHAWHRRVIQKRPWQDIGGVADTTEAMERTLAIAVGYAAEQALMSQAIANNTALTQSSETMLSMGVGYSCILARLVQGDTLNEHISQRPMMWIAESALSFEPVTTCPGSSGITTQGQAPHCQGCPARCVRYRRHGKGSGHSD